MFFVLKFELILIIGSNNVLMEGARKVYRGRRVDRGWSRQCGLLNITQPYRPPQPVTGIALLFFTSLISTRGRGAAGRIREIGNSSVIGEGDAWNM
jgi:hypothetical protein